MDPTRRHVNPAVQAEVNSIYQLLTRLFSLASSAAESFLAHVSDTAPHQDFLSTAVGVTLGVQTIVKVTAACTITLPTAVGKIGRRYSIDNSSGGTVTVVPTGVERIEGEVSQTMIGDACMTVYSDGVGWRFA